MSTGFSWADPSGFGTDQDLGASYAAGAVCYRDKRYVGMSTCPVCGQDYGDIGSDIRLGHGFEFLQSQEEVLKRCRLNWDEPIIRSEDKIWYTGGEFVLYISNIPDFLVTGKA